MEGIGEYYQSIIDETKKGKLRPSRVNFLKSEIRRLTLINAIVAEILISKRTKDKWVKDFENKLLRQFFTAEKLKAMSSDEKKQFMVELMYPKVF